MFCTKCGSEIAEGARFCTNCGEPLEQASGNAQECEPEEAIAAVEEIAIAEDTGPIEDLGIIEAADTDAIVCEYCGTVLASDAAVCTNCGAIIATGADAEETIVEISETVDGETTVFESVESEENASVYEMNQGSDVSFETDAMPPVNGSSSYAARAAAGGNAKKIIIGAACAVVIVCAVIVALLFTTCSPSDVVVDDATFPDDAIRSAVLLQVDTDGDGVLSASEREAVTGLSLIGDEVQFGLDGGSVNATNITGVSSDENDTKHEVTLGLFPNLRVFVAPAAGLASLDLKGNKNLQYIDVRGNDLRGLDLSNNKEIGKLFCDDSVVLEGIDEASLYFTDLLVSATRTDASAPRNGASVSIVYDTDSRAIARTWGGDTKEYRYDEQGKLVGAAEPDAPWTAQTYFYENTGNLREYIWAHSIYRNTTDVIEEDFSYDASGRILDEASKKSGLPSTVGTYSYENDTTLNPSSFVDEDDGYWEEYTFDPEGRLIQEKTAIDDGSDILGFTYATSGAISRISSAEYGDLTLSFDGQGYPASATLEDTATELPRTDYSFTCNADGYVTAIRAALTDTPSVVRSMEISYVKMVARYDDRIALRFAPSFQPMLNVMLWVHPVTIPLDKALFTMRADSTYDPIFYGCTVYELGPEFVSLRNAGLFPLTLTNENELKLAKWDREHWNEGLNLS